MIVGFEYKILICAHLPIIILKGQIVKRMESCIRKILILITFDFILVLFFASINDRVLLKINSFTWYYPFNRKLAKIPMVNCKIAELLK